MTNPSMLSVLAVLFLATVIRSAFGFGEALIAVPLLALIIPVGVAAPVAVLVSVTVAGVILLQDWREVHAAGAWRLIVSTMFGIPLGLLLLTTVPEPVVKVVLGAVIISFAMYRLVGRAGVELKDDRLAWMFGFGAGVLGGAYGMNAPPLVAYGAMRRWSKEQFRATLQGYFLPASSFVMAGYWMTGLWSSTVTRYYLASLPVVLVATGLGRLINRRIAADRFLVYVHVGLVVIGLILLVQSVWSSGRNRLVPAGRSGSASTADGREARGAVGLENSARSAQPGGVGLIGSAWLESNDTGSDFR
jgi:uncharacterized protein